MPHKRTHTRSHQVHKRPSVRAESRSTPALAVAGALLILLLVGGLSFVIPAEGEDNPHTRLTNEATRPAELNDKNMPPQTDVKPDESWSVGMASGYDFDNNDGWDETASGIPLDHETYTVAVPQEQSELLLRYVEICHNGTMITAQVTDTGGFAQYDRDLDLAPAVWMAFGARTDDEWGVQEVHYRFL